MLELGKGFTFVARQQRISTETKDFFVDLAFYNECPSCGLLEDVTAGGLLVTYPKDSKNLADTGLRFRQLDTESFQCPACGADAAYHLPTESSTGLISV